MTNNWTYIILFIALVILSIMKAHEHASLATHFHSERTIRLKQFENARVAKEDRDLLKLWESILTGRSAPLSKWMKERYKTLALNHIFTPSGFHLSAVLIPIMKVLPYKFHLFILLTIGALLFFVPGFGALKRMVLIKSHQKVFGLHLGFFLALMVDMMFGSFEKGVLSFTYSFLFLGIIYGGHEGVKLVLWFFAGQMLVALFQNQDLSLLILIFSPILNFFFGILMPLLFILSFPLWTWQLSIGIFLLRIVQSMVDTFALISAKFPTIEISIVTFFIALLLLSRKPKHALILIAFFCSSLNLDSGKVPAQSKYEFVPQGNVLRIKNDTVYFEDGRCRRKLVRGFWWENCSPKRRSSRRKLITKL